MILMWKEIETEKDIEDFLEASYSMHDSVLVSAGYSTGCGETDNGMIIACPGNKYELKLVFDSDWCERIELLFTGVRHLNMCCFRDNYSNDIYGCHLAFHNELMGKTRDDRLIVWADNYFSPKIHGTSIDLKESETSFVIADRMKWRIISKEEAEICLQKE